MSVDVCKKGASIGLGMTTLLQKSELRRAQVERSCRSREQRKANAHERILLRAFQ